MSAAERGPPRCPARAMLTAFTTSTRMRRAISWRRAISAASGGAVTWLVMSSLALLLVRPGDHRRGEETDQLERLRTVRFGRVDGPHRHPDRDAGLDLRRGPGSHDPATARRAVDGL